LRLLFIVLSAVFFPHDVYTRIQLLVFIASVLKVLCVCSSTARVQLLRYHSSSILVFPDMGEVEGYQEDVAGPTLGTALDTGTPCSY
jgi:hypothetical protein